MPLMDESIGQLEGFPAGMRVLAVDDDSVVLRSLELMLLKCGYKVTVSQHAFKALELLRAKKDDYDLVITDVNMPDMDGFKLLEIVGLEMDLPVIMLSVDCDVKSVMKGIMHGAVDYLAKPVRLEELKLIWKHVARKSLNEKKDQNDASNKLDHAETPEQVSKLYSSKNCKIHNKERDNEDSADSDEDMARQKKPRIAWTPELHAKFINVVNHLGINRAVPKKILDMMNISGLTRENVASHLQKYRKGLKKNAMELRQQLLNNPGSSLSMAANQQRTAIYTFERSCVDYRIKSETSSNLPRQSCNGYSQAASAWLPHSLGHQDNKFCQRYTMNSLAGQLETKQLGFAAANPYSTKASSQFLNYQSFALRPNQPDSNAETSPHNALASGMDSEFNHRSNQFECNASSSGMNSVFHPAHASGNQTIDMFELDSFLESEHEQQQNFVSCLGEAAGTLEDINWDSLDVQSCSFEDQMGSGPPDFAVCPAEQFPAEISFAFNKAEHTEDLHAAFKQFQR